MSFIAQKHEDFLTETKKDLEDSKYATEVTPSCSQESNQDLFVDTNEPMNSNPSDQSLLLDCDEASNVSSDSINPGVILKNKLKEFCVQAIKYHKSTWKEAIDFAKNLECYYENNLL